MATINTSKLTGSSLDVANIVSQLMEVERKPLNAISAKIERAEVKISALGSFQSKLSALRDAVDRLQEPENFRAFTATSSSASTVTAQTGSDVVPGLYEVEVTRLATNAVVNFSPDTTGLLSRYVFSIGSASPETVTINLSSPSTDPKTHYEALRDAINANASLQDRYRAVLVDNGSGGWGLSVQGLSSGAENTIRFVDGVVLEGEPPLTPAIIAAANFRTAQDAVFKVNNVSYSRPGNLAEVAGLQFNLLATGTSNVEVRESSVSNAEAIQALASSYNNLLAEYKGITSSNVDASQRGVLNSDSSLAAIMRQVNAQLTGSFSSGSSTLSGIGALGLEFADNGQLVYKPSLIADAAQLEAALSRGLYLGSSTSNLSTQLGDTLAFGGMLYERIESEKTAQRDLSRRQASVEEKMQKIEERYTAQYAALDALLFRLNSTNTALKSALDALAAQNQRD